MATYKIGNTTFEADNLVGAIEFVKANSLTGKLVRIKGATNAPATSNGDTERVVTTTCGWGKAAHKWTAPLSEVVANRNNCPEHRG